MAGPAFLHGVETIEVPQGLRPIRQVKTAVIGLVGTAPIHLLDAGNRHVNDPYLVLNEQDAGKLAGPQRPDFTIPQALDAIFDQGAGTVVVVNVFDPSVHKQTVADEALTLSSDGTAVTANPDVITLTLTSSDGTTTYAEGTDYTLDQATGTITRVTSGQIPSGADLKASYDHADPSMVEASDIIGGVDTGGDRTGMQTWLDSFQRFGFFPKLLIAPVYSTQASVAVEMQALAQKDKCRAIALIDAPIGTKRDAALEGRGPEGDINFNVSDNRVALCYPHLKVYDRVTESERLEPFSQRLAGVIARTDMEEGYHVSPSNKPILGIVGAERQLSARINDPTSDVNLLNEAGIITLFNSFGSGLRTWGNRSSAWPSSTAQRQFIQTQRTLDVIAESIEMSMLQFLDGPVTRARIDAVLQSVQEFLNIQENRGALIPGSTVEFLEARNPPAQLASGHVVFTVTAVPPPPMERITFEQVVDINLLSNLFA
jgi:hypothetical protein